MTQESLSSIKNEITFFMEKSFQFSFVYVGAIFAGIASTKLEVMDILAAKLNTKPLLLVVTSILVLNLVYLTLAASCIFAILKRGYFILTHSSEDPEGVLVSWEKFVRKSNREFGDLGWNVDNYYVGVIYFLVLILSLAAFLYGLFNYSGKGVAILFVLLALHILPIWALIQTAKLNAVCRRLIDKREEANVDMVSVAQ
jgi:hypothetical protein